MASTLSDQTTVTTLPGLMMDVPLTIRGILDHAVRNHPKREIVSRDGAGLMRYTYADFGKRVAQLAHALRKLGVNGGDRVASFGWNTHRHLELYYGVPSIGAVLHTTNIRLFPEQVAELLEHAGDKIVFVDGILVPAMQKAIAVRPALAKLTFVIMGESAETLPNAHDYEKLLAPEPQTYAYPEFDENSAAILCYTSATTGEPKGALFSHRSTVIHAFAIGLTDVFSLSQRDSVLPIVPQFHVNAWGLPFLALMVGAKMVMPGAALDPDSVCNLVESEGVTLSAGVPTVWLAARDRLKQTGRKLPTLKRLVIGGSAVPPGLFDDLEAIGIDVIHAWGMTEMSPVGTVSYVKGELAELPPEERRRKRLKQGAFSPIVQWKVLDENNAEVPQDGTSRGELWVRGPAVAREYFQNPAASQAAFSNGWFKTGDIVTVDDDGYMEIVDRSKT
jgi:acyl-CoA synthetase (AMP-forming)/AMP-acid ligase II